MNRFHLLQYVGFDDVYASMNFMYCSVRTHYGLNFSHDELNAVGFDAKELWDIFNTPVIRHASLW